MALSSGDPSDGVCSTGCIARHLRVDLQQGVNERVDERDPAPSGDRLEMKAPPMPISRRRLEQARKQLVASHPTSITAFRYLSRPPPPISCAKRTVAANRRHVGSSSTLSAPLDASSSQRSRA